MTEDIFFVGKFDDPTDPRQLEELWAWMQRIQGRLNQFDQNAFALAWLEGYAAGAVIASAGVASAPVWSTAPLLTGLTLSGLTASQVVVTNASKGLASQASLTVAQGGTGATTLTDNGVLYGNATAAVAATAEGATNTVLKGVTGSPPQFTDSPTVANLTATTAIRMSTAIHRRYYHLALGSANPGVSGATWVDASANTTGGWQLNAASEVLRGQVDIHSDWDGATNPTFHIKFMVNVDNSGGAAGDTVDLQLVVYYKGVGDTATKTQTLEVPTTVGASPQYKQFEATFTVDWDLGGNVLEADDAIAFYLHLETDTSEVGDIVVTSMEFSYATTHVGIESGDV